MRNSVHYWWRRYKSEILLFCFAFGIRLAYAIIIQVFYGSGGFSAYSDAEAYLRVADNLLVHGVISQSASAPFVPDSLRTPLYPFMLAFFLWLKAPLFWIVAAQSVFSGIAIIMVYQLGKILLRSPAAGWIAGILASIEPVSIYWNGLLMADILFSALFIFSLYFFVAKRYALFAVAMGFAILTRPIGLYFLPIFLIVEIFRRDAISRKKFALSLCIIFLMIFPWMARNKIQFGAWGFSSAGWVNVYIFEMSRFAREYSIPFSEPVMPPDYPGHDGSIFSYDFVNIPFYQRETVKMIFVHPFDFIKFHLVSSAENIINHGYSYFMDYVVRAKFPHFDERYGSLIRGAGAGFWVLIYGAALAAFLGKQRRPLFFLAAFVVMNSLLQGYMGIGQGGRYNLPTLPLLFLAGGYGIVLLFGPGINRAYALLKCTKK